MRDRATSIPPRTAAAPTGGKPLGLRASLTSLRRRTASSAAVAAGAVAATVLALLAPAAHAATGHNPIGVVDAVTVAPATGVVTISGWAADVDDPTDVLRVEIHDNGPYAIAVIARTYRPDVSAAVPKIGPYHGFTVRFAAKTGLHRICAVALNHGGGVNSTVGCRTVQVSNDPVGALETSAQQPGGLAVTGYAIDPNVTAPVLVRLYLDGRYAAGRLADAPRPDLQTKYPTAGLNHGFSFLIPAAVGSHQLCAYAMNIGAGTVNTRLGCRAVQISNNAFGTIEASPQQAGGFMVSGYAIDPDVTGSVMVRIYLDGHWVAAGSAATPRPDVQARYPAYGLNHGFSIFTPAAAGSHQLCAYALNLGAGRVNPRFGCVTVSRGSNPVGSGATIARVGTSDAIAVSGWALDPDTDAPIKVQVTSDGSNKQVLTANLADTGSSRSWPRYSTNHGYSGRVTLDGYEHVVCAVAVNSGPGTDVRQGCARISTSGSTAPAAPTDLSAWPGSKLVNLNWTAARSVTTPVTSYEITIAPGGRVITVAGTAVSAPVTGLTNGVRYSFTVRGVNALGRGSAAVTTAAPSNIPPQFTPAPVSTSHYLRNLTGNATTDAALMRKMGAVDASYNPSGHSYLVLLQIGGQDEYRKGALLSATARFVSYPAVVTAMKAYLDGYATTQKPYAPLTLAIGTNNDVDVSASAGASWARNVVSPVASYAARYPGSTIAGANDIEPGFSATVSQSRAWLSGYLGATSAKYVFNGSADGCSTVSPGSRCNNGWSASDLQWLSGGAAPGRTISLPQIYNYAMPLQWKNISLTGTSAGRPRIYFGGPLTEYTACVQAGSCGSISNVDAWNRLWSAISSSAATRQYDMPHGTDLRIN